MKLSDALVVALFLVMGSLVFVMKKMQSEYSDEPLSQAQVTLDTPAKTAINLPEVPALTQKAETAEEQKAEIAAEPKMRLAPKREMALRDDIPQLRPQIDPAEQAGRHGRLDVDDLLAKNVNEGDVTLQFRKSPSASADLSETLVQP